MSRRTVGAAVAAVAAGLVVGAAATVPLVAAGATDGSARSGSGGLQVQPLPRPRDFVRVVDNPYLPFERGMRWVYRVHEGGETQHDVMRVLDHTRSIEGIDATVVRDTVSVGGEVVEDTHDWYAQDTAGNVWYLGERSLEYDGNQVSTAGSWEAGKHGASAGVIMPADPVVGRTYRQEYRRGVAEDRAKMVDLDTMVKVPYGFFPSTRLTEEGSDLEPRVDEMKFYARGIGVVEEDAVSPGPGRTVLLSFRHP